MKSGMSRNVSESFICLSLVLVICSVIALPVGELRAESVSTTKPMESAESDESKILSEVQIIGIDESDLEFVRQYIKNVKVNKPLVLADVQKDLDNLKLTGRYVDVYATTKPAGSKVILIFHVVQRQRISSLQFIGARDIEVKELYDLLSFGVGDPLDMLKVKSGVEEISAYYRKNGHNEVKVVLNPDGLNEGNVDYLITEGPRLRVTAIEFEGNVAFSDRALRKEVSTKKYRWIFSPGTFAEDRIEDDIAGVRNYYRRQGYLDAEVGRRVDYSDDRTEVVVTFLIEEGICYTIDSVSVTGNANVETQTLLDQMRLTSGSIMNLDRMESDRKAIVGYYGSLGYIYAVADLTYTFADELGLVNLKVQVREGDTYNVGRIIIRGNKKTQDRVIRRTLDMYPTQVFDLAKMQDRERRLRESRLFRDVKVRPIDGDNADERNMLIQLEEADTTRVMAGMGVTSNSGVVGSLSIENWNFNFFDTPRSMGEFFRGQSYKGAGQTLKVSFEPGTELTSFRIDFKEPYVNDMPLSFNSSAYLFERDRDDYSVERLGLIFGFDKRFRDIYSAGVAFRLERATLDDIQEHFWFFAAKDVLEAEGSNTIMTFKLRGSRDTTDSYLMPSKGTLLEASWEQAFGDYTFSKFMLRGTYFKTLRTDIYDRKTIWSSNVTLGYIAGDAPVYERFYGGGIGSIRGFEYRGVSPRQWPSNTAVGGTSELLVGNEISFPLVGETLRGVTFLDMGSVDDDFGMQSWRASIGFGLRLTLDFFGPVPMAFDFAVPISKDEEDDTQIFSFSLGASFR